MALSDYDGFINSATNGKLQQILYFKNTYAEDGTGSVSIPWTIDGIPGPGATPATGSGTIPTSATTGAIQFTNPTGGDKTYLTKFNLVNAGAQKLDLIDILWFNSGLSGTSTSTQTINSTALTRYTNGAGLSLGVICWAATGSTASNITATYTNSAGTGSRTTPTVALWTDNTVVASSSAIPPSATQFQELPLNSADDGIRSVESIQLSASTLTTGNFGMCIFKRLGSLYTNAAGFSPVERDMMLDFEGLVEIQDSACLSFIQTNSSSTSILVAGTLEMIQG